MNIWVLTGSYEGEQFASSHLTEQGAVIAAIADVLELLGVGCEETAKEVYGRRVGRFNEDKDDEAAIEPPECDIQKMKSMLRPELWNIFNAWSELTWDSHMSYQVEVIKTQVQA